MHYPDWPLGQKFINSEGITFEVILTIWGYPRAEVIFKHEFYNGWRVITQGDSYPQTAVGFVAEGTDKVIRHSVEKMNEYVTNKHLAKI